MSEEFDIDGENERHNPAGASPPPPLYPAAEREARRQELCQFSRRRLADLYHRGAGQLMTMSELMRWNHEELEAAILDSEFGPRPSAVHLPGMEPDRP